MNKVSFQASNPVDRHCVDFVNGLSSLQQGKEKTALGYFQQAFNRAPADNFYFQKYASFCGMTRVLCGDESGIEICREMASLETLDGDVFFNLAFAEWLLGDRSRCVFVLQQGLEIDPYHPGLNRLRSALGVRSRPVLSVFPRNHLLNRWLGRMLRKAPEQPVQVNICDLI